MAWSTSELAEMAGTTVNTIRHYHRLGLLPEPERGSNGYKHYGVRELVCLLRIRRLADLGVPLSQIGDVASGADSTPEALRALDAELETTIARLQRARDDIATILREGSPADAPAGFESLATRLTEADSSVIHIYSRLYDESAMADVRRVVEADAQQPVARELDALPADADEATRQRIAEAYAPILARNLVEYPWMNDPGARLPKGAAAAAATFVEALVEFYNPAQLDVFARASTLARARIDAGLVPEPDAPEPPG